MSKVIGRVGILCSLMIAAACTAPSPSSDSATNAAPSRAVSATVSKAESARSQFALKNAENVGVIRVVEPSGGDNVEALRPVFLAAYKKACHDVSSVESQFRSNRSSTFIVVRCDGTAQTRAVRVIYTGVSVPDLVGDSAHGLNELGALLKLHIVATTRHVPAVTNKIVSQYPAPGTIVPLGSRLYVTVVQ